jgi:hypothetical protein
VDGPNTLRETLAELQRELRALETESAGPEALGDEAREALREAAREIERALGGRPADGESLRRRLAEAIERFEGSHPTLTGVVGRVVDALSELGI